MSDVRLSNLRKIYPASGKNPAFEAVKGINLDIDSKEFMVLVGPSGCGKSTTLRMIAGLEEITGGEISIGERVVNNVEPKNRDIAMVFQNYALYPHMTVYDNMGFGLRLRRLPKAEIKERILEAAKILGIEGLLDRKPKALSGGQRQRVAVGRAIVRNPQVFLFDEPLSNLDAKMRVSMRNEISRLHARLGATMIYVTHDQVEAMTMGSRICVMDGGRIMQVDTPIELYNNPKNLFVASFIGSPPMNVLRGAIRSDGEQLVFQGDSSDDASPIAFPLSPELATLAEDFVDGSILFGIRPEAIAVLDSEMPSRAHAGYSHTQTVVVDMCEPHGAETMLYAKVSGGSLVARIPGAKHWQRGERVQIEFDLARAKLFDPNTEETIS